MGVGGGGGGGGGGGPRDELIPFEFQLIKVLEESTYQGKVMVGFPKNIARYIPT